MKQYNKYLNDNDPTFRIKQDKYSNNPKINKILGLHNQLKEKTNIYVKAHKRYVDFVKKYVNMKSELGTNVNKTATLKSGGSDMMGYMTPNGYFLKNDNASSEMATDCPANSNISFGTVNDMKQDMNNPKSDTSTKSFMIGRSSRGQPCGKEGKNVYVNLPNTVMDSEIKYHDCYSGSDTSKLYKQNDMGINGYTTYDECKQRMEDLGASVFTLSNYNTTTGTAICSIGNDLEAVTNGETKVHKNKFFFGPGFVTGNTSESKNPDANVTLLKNGKLIIWDCKNNSCIDSSNNNLKNNSIPWDKSSNTLKSNVVWRSTDHGGKVNEKCHEYYAGNINDINANWGANCVAEPSAFIPGAPIVPPGTSGNPPET